MSKIVITKHLLRDLKECRTIAINFDGKYSDMRLIADKRESTYALEASNYESTWQNGFWYAYNSDFSAIINNTKVGDVVYLKMYENGSESLTEAGFRHVVLSATVHRRSEKTGKTLKEWTYNLDSMVAPKDSTNFKNFKV